jgi:hypothetical protein
MKCLHCPLKYMVHRQNNLNWIQKTYTSN